MQRKTIVIDFNNTAGTILKKKIIERKKNVTETYDDEYKEIQLCFVGNGNCSKYDYEK